MGSLTKAEVPRVKLGVEGFEVSKQGLGCMGMSAFYGTPKPEDEMIALMKHAVELGVTFFDTSDVYGPHTNEVLVGKAIKAIGREKVQLATKFANSITPDGQMQIRGDPEYVRHCCEGSLQRLGIDYIDLYYQHRVDTKVPIEVTVGAMKKLVEEGKVKYLGLSEASADTIRRAHAVHPIAAVQLEWSLWTRDVEESIIPTCRELGIGIVPYSPLGRGFLTGKLAVEALEKNDRRASMPRFSSENVEANKKLYQRVVDLATKHKCSPGQLALAWVQHQGDDVVPIPGTTKVPNLEENIAALQVHLTAEELQAVSSLISPDEVAGDRYAAAMQKHSWAFATTPPLATWQA